MGIANEQIGARLRPLHQPPKPFARHLLAFVVFGVAVSFSVAAYENGLFWAVLLLWFGMAWLDHAMLTRLHEAAHRMLAGSAMLNEIAGVVIGTLSLTPLSVYRYVHAQHHAHLGREKDPEFRPYNLPAAPRWLRLLYAWSELLLGFAFTPFLYSIRTRRVWTTLSTTLRKRLVLEWTVLMMFWMAVLLAVGLNDRWTWLIVGYLAPAWIAGSMQTVRKFTEHLGRFGDTILGMTRTVVYTGPVGLAASRSQLHVEQHGTHHRWAGIPYYNLPQATEIVYGSEDAVPTFPSHFAAVLDMLPHLANPRVGPQWKPASFEQ